MNNQDKNYHELRQDLMNCKDESELYTVAKFINDNSKRLRLDEIDIQKLESAGMRRYEEIVRDRNYLMKNKKG